MLHAAPGDINLKFRALEENIAAGNGLLEGSCEFYNFGRYVYISQEGDAEACVAANTWGVA